MLEVGQRILNERLRRGITQAELAALTGIPQPNLSMIEKGRRDITVSTLRRISLALGKRAGDLLDGPLEANSSEKFGRERIENLAKDIVAARGSGPASADEDELAALFRAVLPQPKARSLASQKSTLKAWLELRHRLNTTQIRAVLDRVRDESQRVP